MSKLLCVILPLSLLFIRFSLFRFNYFNVQWERQNGSDPSNLIELCMQRDHNRLRSSTVRHLRCPLSCMLKKKENFSPFLSHILYKRNISLSDFRITRSEELVRNE